MNINGLTILEPTATFLVLIDVLFQMLLTFDGKMSQWFPIDTF